MCIFCLSVVFRNLALVTWSHANAIVVSSNSKATQKVLFTLKFYVCIQYLKDLISRCIMLCFVMYCFIYQIVHVDVVFVFIISRFYFNLKFWQYTMICSPEEVKILVKLWPRDHLWFLCPYPVATTDSNQLNLYWNYKVL